MERLREEAEEQGGLVLSNLGNHEWMNAIGKKSIILVVPQVLLGSL
jgi:hypothetical protein